MTKIPIATDSTYKTNRDKIIRLIRECSQLIRMPANLNYNWDSLERQAMAALPEYKERIPLMISKCLEKLKAVEFVPLPSPPFPQGAYSYNYDAVEKALVDCVDYIGDEMKVQKVQLGMFEGLVGRMLRDNKAAYANLMPALIPKIIKILEE